MTRDTTKAPRGPLSWAPRRYGPYYCSPACGGSCTYDAYVRATIDAGLLAQLLGPAWTPHVFENLGWHTHVRACGGALTIAMHTLKEHALDVGVQRPRSSARQSSD
jgi:hypothetical protein